MAENGDVPLVRSHGVEGINLWLQSLSLSLSLFL